MANTNEAAVDGAGTSKSLLPPSLQMQCLHVCIIYIYVITCISKTMHAGQIYV